MEHTDMKKRVLAGINTTGTLLSIGNYVGAIRPAIQDSKESGRAELLLHG